MTLLKKGYVVIFPGAILALWWVVTQWHLVDPVILPAPDAVLRAGVAMLTPNAPDSALPDVLLTLRRLAAALTASVCIGLPVGLILGYQLELYRNVESVLHALRSVPATALFPLLLIVIGVGEGSLIFVASYPGILIVLINAASGAAGADPRRIHQAEVLGMTPVQMITRVLFYEALPLVFGGIRTVVSYALVLVIAVEMFIGVGDRGLGRRIFDMQSSYRIPEAYAAIGLTSVLGILLNELVNSSERHFLRWQRRSTQGRRSPGANART